MHIKGWSCTRSPSFTSCPAGERHRLHTSTSRGGTAACSSRSTFCRDSLPTRDPLHAEIHFTRARQGVHHHAISEIHTVLNSIDASHLFDAHRHHHDATTTAFCCTSSSSSSLKFHLPPPPPQPSPPPPRSKPWISFCCVRIPLAPLRICYESKVRGEERRACLPHSNDITHSKRKRNSDPFSELPPTRSSQRPAFTAPTATSVHKVQRPQLADFENFRRQDATSTS